LIFPLVFPNYRKADMLPPKAIAPDNKPDSCLTLAILLVVGSRSLNRRKPPLQLLSSILCFTLGVGVATTALLGIANPAIAQPSAPNQMPMGEKTMSQVNVLFVNPSVGDDKLGNGSERAPLKTITQALQLALPNTVIMLSRGTYSTQTGEVFPLILKPRVSIQGDSYSKGREIEIQGGGDYLSRSFGGQNATIVGANQAGLTGVTVTNPNRRGYGLWIESSNPLIVENTFTGSTQDGISVNGSSAPIVSKNYFYRNGANGITIDGNSHPEVRENVFEQTGFGINIAKNATPMVVGNQIKGNRAGIIVQANARPILRNNVIEGSKEDGLVAIANALPDLGNASEPGGNQFRNNGRYDINALAAKQVISAAGNSLGSDRIAGKIDLQGGSAIASLPNNPAPRTLANREITFEAPSISQTPKLKSPSLRSNIPSTGLNPQLLPLQSANSPLSVASKNQQQAISKIPTFPTPSTLPGYRSSVSAPSPIATNALASQLNYVQVDRNTIEFNAPQTTSPPLEATSVSDMRGSAPENSTTMYRGQSPLSMGVTQTGLRYRVMVEIANQTEQDLVRFIAPGAFATVSQGRGVMQAGVFSSRYNANQMLKLLNRNGLRGMIEPTN
jgi:parallel beta-helix repeat protein